MKKRCIKEISGFTLIELLVVVLIIGILAAIALPQYNKAVEKSRIAGAISVINSVAKGIEVYLLDNGGYPGRYESAGLSRSEYFVLYGGGLDASSKRIETAIDIRGSLRCEGSFCMDSNFMYESICTDSTCWVDAYRSADAYNGEGSYFLGMARRSSTNQWEYYCYYYDDFGQRACNTLQGQGNWEIANGNE